MYDLSPGSTSNFKETKIKSRRPLRLAGPGWHAIGLPRDEPYFLPWIFFEWIATT